jgi:hypothetical protein
MPHPNTRSRKPAAAAVVILLLACVGLAACGGSSSTTSTGANAASTHTASTGTGSTGTASTGASPSGSSSSGSNPSSAGAGRGGARFAAVRECLEKNGITLPQRAPGSGGHAGARGGLLGAGAGALPKGVTRAQYEAALRKCGAGAAGLGRGTPLANNHVFEAALAKFAECLRQNGVNVPAPNTSGKGPVFDTKGINTSSPQFRVATTKCRATLTSAFRSAR